VEATAPRKISRYHALGMNSGNSPTERSERDVLHGQVVNAELGSERSITRFAYGVSSIADLVIGANGVRSFIKWAIFNEKDANHFAPVYEYGHCSPIAARR
jgi:hypothetical protein